MAGRKAVLLIGDMDCASDCPIIEKTLKKKDGVIGVTVNFVTEKMYIRYDDKRLSLGEIENEIKRLGYTDIILKNA
ncbi:MAG: cation transporter [Candidatus Micrarchaeota archaeon]